MWIAIICTAILVLPILWVGIRVEQYLNQVGDDKIDLHVKLATIMRDLHVLDEQIEPRIVRLYEQSEINTQLRRLDKIEQHLRKIDKIERDLGGISTTLTQLNEIKYQLDASVR